MTTITERVAAFQSVCGVGEELSPSQTSRFVGLFLRCEIAKDDVFSTHLCLSNPLLDVFAPSYPTIDRRRPSVRRLVLRILPRWHFAKIVSTVVQAIPVNVIAIEAIPTGQSQQSTVQAVMDGASPLQRLSPDRASGKLWSTFNPKATNVFDVLCYVTGDEIIYEPPIEEWGSI